MPMKVWTYVIAVDKGAAPNFEPPEATLTICKPRIRKRAGRGELVLAFNGVALNSATPHSVSWAGLVLEVIRFEDYWNDPRFEGKKPGRLRKPGESPDNIYRPVASGGFEQIANESHKRTEMERDLSGVNALVLKPVWRFGLTGPILPEDFNGLRMIRGRIGQRCVEIDEPTWCELKRWLDNNAPDTSAVESLSDCDTICLPEKRSRRIFGSGRCGD
jgi:Nucleotide modification associated domain 2